MCSTAIMSNTGSSFELWHINVIVNLKKQINELSMKLNKITKTLETNNSFKQSNILCDVILLTDDGIKIPAHKVILASASPVFLTMFNENFEEKNKQVIPIKGINSTILNVLFDYIYTFKLNVTVENVEEILRAADYFNMDNIKDICYDFVKNVINYGNCLHFMKFSELISFKKLYDLSFSFVLQHFFKVKEFTLGDVSLYDLTCEEILKFISSDNLITVSEEKVFHFILDWVKIDEENRKTFFSQLIKCVRFSHLSKYQIGSVFNEPLVKKNINCLDLIMERKKFRSEKNIPELFIPFNVLRTEKRRLPLHIGNPNVIIAIKNDAIDIDENYASFLVSPVHSGSTMQTFKDKLFVPPKRYSKIVALENGVLFSIGGETDDGVAIRDVFILDLSYLHPTWVLTTPMIFSRKDFAVCLYDKNIFAVCGVGEDGVSVLDSIEVFNIETKTWSLIEVLMSPRSHCSAIYYNGSICVIGGKNENHSSTESIECIKVSSTDSTFIDIKPLPYPLHNTSVTIFNYTLYVIGGMINNKKSKIIYKINLLSGGEWSSVASLVYSRESLNSVVINGKLIIFGKVQDYYRSVRTYIYPCEFHDIFDDKFFSYNDKLNFECNNQSAVVLNKNLLELVGISFN